MLRETSALHLFPVICRFSSEVSYPGSRLKRGLSLGYPRAGCQVCEVKGPPFLDPGYFQFSRLLQERGGFHRTA